MQLFCNEIGTKSSNVSPRAGLQLTVAAAADMKITHDSLYSV